MNNTHYIVVCDWAKDYQIGITIYGVAHSQEEAEKIFKENIEKEKDWANELEMEVWAETEDCFDASTEYYTENHTCTRIIKTDK